MREWGGGWLTPLSTYESQSKKSCLSLPLQCLSDDPTQATGQFANLQLARYIQLYEIWYKMHIRRLRIDYHLSHIHDSQKLL